jgi:hypothetical protein
MHRRELETYSARRGPDGSGSRGRWNVVKRVSRTEGASQAGLGLSVITRRTLIRQSTRSQYWKQRNGEGRKEGSKEGRKKAHHGLT